MQEHMLQTPRPMPLPDQAPDIFLIFVGRKDNRGPVWIDIAEKGQVRNKLAELAANSPLKLQVLGGFECHPAWREEIHSILAMDLEHGSWFSRSKPLKDLLKFARTGDFASAVNYMLRDFVRDHACDSSLSA